MTIHECNFVASPLFHPFQSYSLLLIAPATTTTCQSSQRRILPSFHAFRRAEAIFALSARTRTSPAFVHALCRFSRCLVLTPPPPLLSLTFLALHTNRPYVLKPSELIRRSADCEQRLLCDDDSLPFVFLPVLDIHRLRKGAVSHHWERSILIPANCQFLPDPEASNKAAVSLTPGAVPRANICLSCPTPTGLRHVSLGGQAPHSQRERQRRRRTNNDKNLFCFHRQIDWVSSQ